MRISNILLDSFLAFPLVLALGACSDDKKVDDDPFDTLQDCYDDHTGGDEHLPIQQAIVVCCLNHPIAGMKAPTCPDTQTACVTHVHAELPSVLDADVTAACMTYITEKQK
jgi:hypothetical protein